MRLSPWLIALVLGATTPRGTLAAQSTLVVASVTSPSLASNVVGMDSLVAVLATPEMIVVMPDANNALGAGFYANSGHRQLGRLRRRRPRAPRNEQYRTDRQPSRRALVGHSMGGFGALVIGFNTLTSVPNLTL